MATSAKLEKLIIRDKAKASKKFEVLVNPATVSHNFELNYDTSAPPGTAFPEIKWKNNGPEKLSFDLVFDGTGIIDKKAKPVADQIKAFKDVALNYDGKIHEPPTVMVLWGTIALECRLASFDVTYNLFKPSGAPLRATAKVSFIGTTDKEEEQKRIKKSSPDLTHIRVMTDSDNLLLMCKEIYNDVSMYIHVAKVNGIVNFRNIEPGTEIIFPPIKK